MLNRLRCTFFGDHEYGEDRILYGGEHVYRMCRNCSHKDECSSCSQNDLCPLHESMFLRDQPKGLHGFDDAPEGFVWMVDNTDEWSEEDVQEFIAKMSDRNF